MNVADMIRLNARARPSEEALVCGDERLTYAAFNDDINRTAHALLEQGVMPGTRVAVLGRNSISYCLLYFALAKIGAILVPLNFWHRANEIAYVLQDSEPALVLFEPQYADLMRESMASLHLKALLINGDDQRDLEFDRFRRADDRSEPDVAVDEQSPHIILYTSGTTGRPKGAVLSHRRTVMDAFAMAGALCLRPNDVYVSFFPPFHTASWDHQKLFWLVGGRVVLLSQFEAGTALEAFERERATVMLGVPTMFRSLLEHPNFNIQKLSSIRLIYFGAYDPSGIVLRVADTFGARDGKIDMAHTYGLTEAGPFVSFCPPSEVFEHWGSIGRAVPGVEIALLDDQGVEVPTGSAGEICIRGPHMSGYWRAEAESASALAGGWMHTGDVAVADGEGFLRIVDRKKDVIRSGGHNIFSKEVEDCLVLHPAIADAAVIGLYDPVYEEKVCAIIKLAEGHSPTDEMKQNIVEFVRTRSAGYNAPKSVIFVDQLPKSVVGKTLKHVLRKQYGGNESLIQRQPLGDAQSALPT